MLSSLVTVEDHQQMQDGGGISEETKKDRDTNLTQSTKAGFTLVII